MTVLICNSGRFAAGLAFCALTVAALSPAAADIRPVAQSQREFALQLALSPEPLPGAAPAASSPAAPPAGASPVGAPPAGASPLPGGNGITAVPLPMPPTAPPAQPPSAGVAPAAADSVPAGSLDDANRGLGRALWQGSVLSRLMELLPRLPAPVMQPSLRDLQLRLLLTATDSPQAGNADPLVPLRAERLHAMGFDAEALQLITQTAVAKTPDAQGAFEKALAQGDDAGACANAAPALAAQLPDLYWRKALIFCQLVAGQKGQAALGLDLLRERAEQSQADQDFIAVAAVANGEVPVARFKRQIEGGDPLLAALLRHAGLPTPTMASLVGVAPVGPAAAATLARDASQPLAARIAAGETAFAAGLLPAEVLTDLYNQVPQAGADAADAADTPETRALLYQAALRGQMPEARAALIVRALDRAAARGAYFPASILYAPLLADIVPNPALVGFAPKIMRALLAAGNSDKAGFWLTLAESGAGRPEIAASLPGLELLGRIAGITSAASSSAPSDPRAAALLAGLGMGAAAPVSSLAEPAAGIAAAAAAGKRGETLLLCLIGFGDRLAAADPTLLTQAIGGLRAVGLEGEARRVAIEAAIGSGL